MKKLIKDAVQGYISFEEKYIKIIDSPQFQRLKNIRQTSYSSLYPSSSHDRFTHSLGVFQLGNYSFEHFKENFLSDYSSNDFDEDFWDVTKEIFLFACLLHDIGHSPFSHTGENFYLRMRTEDNSIYIYKELIRVVDDEQFANQFNASITNNNVAKPHEIMSAIIGIKAWFNGRVQQEKELFARMIIGLPYAQTSDITYGVYNALIYLLNSSVIDVDKLDYLLRDKMMTGFEGVSIDTERLLASVCLVNESIGKKEKYHLGYYKNALSVIENVVVAHDFEKKWIQTNAVILYESFLVQKCITAIEAAYCSSNESISIFSEKALGTEGEIVEGQNIRLLSDADIIYLAKQIKPTNPNREYIDEYFDRGLRKKAIWKSQSEFDLMLKEVNDAERTLFVEWLDELKFELSNGSDSSDYAFVINPGTKQRIEEENNRKQNDEKLPNDEKRQANDLYESLIAKIDLFKKYAESNKIEFNFVVASGKRFTSNSDKLSKNEILIKYKNFEYPKSIAEVISTYSLKEQSVIADAKSFYYIYYHRTQSKTITPAEFIKEFLSLIKVKK